MLSKFDLFEKSDGPNRVKQFFFSHLVTHNNRSGSPPPSFLPSLVWGTINARPYFSFSNYFTFFSSSFFFFTFSFFFISTSYLLLLICMLLQVLSRSPLAGLTPSTKIPGMSKSKSLIAFCCTSVDFLHFVPLPFELLVKSYFCKFSHGKCAVVISVLSL